MVTYYMIPFLSCSGKQQQNKDNEKISGCQELGVRVRFDYKRTARGTYFGDGSKFVLLNHMKMLILVTEAVSLFC